MIDNSINRILIIFSFWHYAGLWIKIHIPQDVSIQYLRTKTESFHVGIDSEHNDEHKEEEVEEEEEEENEEKEEKEEEEEEEEGEEEVEEEVAVFVWCITIWLTKV